MTDPEQSREWQRGLLSTCVLAVLALGSAHGYAVAQRLREAGIGPVKGGALYPVLNRLEDDGLVTSVWREGEGGPGRKVFAVTPAGRDRLVQMRREWQPFATAVGNLLGGESPTIVPPAERV
jgi:PadR family transcriptional regulator PadR